MRLFSSSPTSLHPFSIPLSICLVLSVTSLPCQAMREKGRHRPCHCPRPNPRNINSVFLEQQRRALASNLSDLIMSGPLFLGPFIWFPLSSRLHSNKVLGPQHKRVRNCMRCVTHQALHQFSLNRTSCVWLCQQVLQVKWEKCKVCKCSREHLPIGRPSLVLSLQKSSQLTIVEIKTVLLSVSPKIYSHASCSVRLNWDTVVLWGKCKHCVVTTVCIH